MHDDASPEVLAAREADRLKSAAFAETSVAVQGLPTLERLLYGADAARLRSQDEDAGYRCALLRAITANLSAIGGAMLAEWTAPDGYAAVVASEAGGKGVYHSADEATLDLLKCMLTALELTADQRLTQPMGGDPAKARPRALEAWRSGRPLRNALLSLEAVEALYLAGPGGFSDAVKAAGAADLDARVRSEFAHAHDAATAIDRPLQEAVMELDGRFRIEVLATHLRSLRDLMARDVALALSISPGFNSLDGD